MKKFHGHNHGLKVSAFEDSSEQMCSVCELELSGEAYSCTKRDCDFILHKSCSDLPKKIQHKSHPDHTFALISEPSSMFYYCDACGDRIYAFGFQCDECDDRHMHVKCALLPDSVECKAHRAHNLDLNYTESKANTEGYSFFTCDVCEGGVSEGHWTYYCKECDFGTHLECAASAEAVEEEEEEDIPGSEKFHSHNHGLIKLSTDVIEADSICSVCELELELELSGEAYSCGKRDCDFILHKSCFELPKKIQHKSHTEHSFSLISEPPEYSIYYDCNACGDLIRAFGFQCDECNRRMHVKCALLPESVECKAHSHHKLDLYYTESKANTEGYTFFTCDVCEGGVTEGYWTYYCKECDFGTHLECAASAEAPVHDDKDEDAVHDDKDEDAVHDDKDEDEEVVQEEEEDEEDLPAEVQLARARIRMEQQRMNLEFQMRMARQNAEFVTSIANSWRNFL